MPPPSQWLHHSLQLFLNRSWHRSLLRLLNLWPRRNLLQFPNP